MTVSAGYHPLPELVIAAQLFNDGTEPVVRGEPLHTQRACSGHAVGHAVGMQLGMQWACSGHAVGTCGGLLGHKFRMRAAATLQTCISRGIVSTVAGS